MLSELQNTCLRSIPSVESILNHELTREWFSRYPRWVLVEGIRKVLDLKREWIMSLSGSEEIADLEGFRIAVSVDLILKEAGQYLRAELCSELGRVINGTGIILHTNLGRAVLARQAVENLRVIAGGYSNLEFDLSTGKRGKRGDSLTRLLCHLTGAEDALVVNNNAAAVLLVLNTLAESREVLVSRGELVEIGGSFRVPDVIKKGGARLVEVGTTNKTRLEDYRQAVTEQSIAILKVHPSNFRITGFTEEASLPELVGLGRELGLVVIYDLGSGLLVDLSPYGLEEPLVSLILRQGLDIVTFSGDKLLGGPQAGIILCRQKYAQDLRKNPLFRALRLDKMTLASLESTLKLYSDPDVLQKVPTLHMITTSLECIRDRGRRILENLPGVVHQYDSDRNNSRSGDHIKVEIVDDDAQVGGGAFPMQAIPSLSLALSFADDGGQSSGSTCKGTVSPDADDGGQSSGSTCKGTVSPAAGNRGQGSGSTCKGTSPPETQGQINRLEEQFRLGRPPVLGRINKGRFLLNLRTIQEEDLPDLIRALRQVLEYGESKRA
jgi:L-seryl-tRNA(Ser) seleniumtransferase